MTITKHDFPILEFDSNKIANIMPTDNIDYEFPQKAVFAFMDNEFDEYLMEHDCELIGSFPCVTKLFCVYKTTYKGKEICLCQAPIGASAAVQIFELLIASGVTEIIGVGCCGALASKSEGEFFVPDSALRDEGTSYHYMLPSRTIDIDNRAVEIIEKSLTENNHPYTKCKTWTTDGFYRETKDMIAYRLEEGCLTVEMECASLAACAHYRDITYGHILFTADSLKNKEQADIRNYGGNIFVKALKVALDSIVSL